jgi:hypothetical protein
MAYAAATLSAVDTYGPPWGEETGRAALPAVDGDLRVSGAAKTFSEKVSGAQGDRPVLAKLLRRLEPVDMLVVTRLDSNVRGLMFMNWLETSMRGLTTSALSICGSKNAHGL